MRQPIDQEIDKFRENSTLISFLYPARNKTLVDQLASKKINAFGKKHKIVLFNVKHFFVVIYLSNGLHSTYN